MARDPAPVEDAPRRGDIARYPRRFAVLFASARTPRAMTRLNATQATVLLWIAEGSPAGVMEGSAHRVSAAALRTRGFVRTSGTGKTWKAEITDAGRDWLRRLEAGDTSQSEACSFCGLSETSGAHLVHGPGVYICHDCVHLAAEIVAGGGVATDRVGSCTLVLEDASRHDVASGIHEVISRLGREDSALVIFELVDGDQLAVRRQAVRQVHVAAEPPSPRPARPAWAVGDNLKTPDNGEHRARQSDGRTR